MNFHFRLNANKSIGIGHLIRNLRLANKLKKRGNNCIFYLDKPSKNFKILKNFKIYFLYKSKETFKNEENDADKFLKKIKKRPGYVVIDDSRLNLLWEKKVSSENFKIIVFEDMENKKHFSDFYINGKPKFYDDENFNRKNILKKNCQVLIGPKYSILECNKKNKIKDKIFKVLFYIGGGSDFRYLNNIISNLLNEDHKIKRKFKIVVVIGPFSTNKRLIYSLSSKYKKINLVENNYNIDRIIKNADLVVGSAGNIIYETAFYKIPSIFFQISKNQINDIKTMEKLGHYFVLKKKDLLQKKKISTLVISMINQYSRVLRFKNNPKIKIDNKGIDRLVDLFEKKIQNKKINYKPLEYTNKKINFQSYKIEKVNDKNINEYLKSRNIRQNIKSSKTKKKISSLDHYIWWLNTKRNSYILKKNKKALMYFYDEIINLDKFNYSKQGWFVATNECNIKDVFYALSWQKKLILAKKNIDKSLGVFKKKNKLGKYISKYFGWKPIINDKYLKMVAKQIYKVDDSYLFYFR